MQDISEREQQLNDTINRLKDENSSLKNELNKLRPLVNCLADKLSDLEGKQKMLFEVTRARELSDKQKDYINNGNIPKVKNKGIKI